MKVSDIVAKIKADCPGFQHVDHVFSAPGDLPRPLALVAPVKREASDRRLVGQQVQDVRATFGVYVILTKATDDPGENVADDLDALCAELRAALVGFRPIGTDPGEQPLIYAGGELAEREGIVCWREDFSTRIDMRHP